MVLPSLKIEKALVLALAAADVLSLMMEVGLNLQAVVKAKLFVKIVLKNMPINVNAVENGFTQMIWFGIEILKDMFVDFVGRIESNGEGKQC